MIIISLTSYKQRLKYIHKVLRTLFEQTVPADKIILNLSAKDRKYMGWRLRRMLKKGLVEVYYYDVELLPHNKYYHTMMRYRDAVVITVDDDQRYRPDMVEKLLDSYKAHPDCISANRVHRIVRDGAGNALSYAQWESECSSIIEPSSELFATGVGGVLYPPDILKLSEDNLPYIRRCITADDIYLKWLENRLGIKVVWPWSEPPYGSRKLGRAHRQRRALCRINKDQGLNDEYLKLFRL